MNLRHAVRVEARAGDEMVWTSGLTLGPVAARSTDWLEHWADKTPDATCLAERDGAGWARLSYAEVLERVRAIAGGLVAAGLGPDQPLMILSGNSTGHALLGLGAQWAGVPYVPVAEQYAVIEAAHPRLRGVAELIRPAAIWYDATRAGEFAAARALPELAGLPVLDLDALQSAPGLCEARGAPGTVAKYLLTSGSTSAPKAVPTTHAMMCTNQAQIAAALPHLSARAPAITDWLPWNHVFGGSHNANMMLAHGGALYIDDGRPVAGRFERSLENLRLAPPTAIFNVPVGFAMLLDALRNDRALARRVLGEVEMLFYAGAALPREVWEGLEALCREVAGRVPLMVASWGLTETAPAAVMQYEPVDAASAGIGVPLPGVEARLIPADAPGRFEIRLRGPNVFAGYHGSDPGGVFDEDGWFITGDAVRMIDPDDPARGLRFDGRLAEDFKLVTGTRVRAAELRASVLEALDNAASDVVITGEGRAEVGVLIFAGASPVTGDEIAARLARAQRGAGSASRVARALVLDEPPSIGAGEITAKGNLNPRAVLSRRAEAVERLYAGGEDVIEIGEDR